MNDPDTELAVEIVHTASEPVAQLIFDQANERIRALQTAAHALDARASQVAALQFAGAALAGGAALGGQLTIFAAASAFFFVLGGVSAFRAVESGDFHPPGIAPVWWEAVLTQPLTKQDARAWAAGVLQTAIRKVDEENCERAKHLNNSLMLAVVGAALIAAGAIVKAIQTFHAAV